MFAQHRENIMMAVPVVDIEILKVGGTNSDRNVHLHRTFIFSLPHPVSLLYGMFIN